MNESNVLKYEFSQQNAATAEEAAGAAQSMHHKADKLANATIAIQHIF